MRFGEIASLADLATGLQGLPLRELRLHFAQSSRPATDSDLDALRADPRAGARALAASLAARRDRSLREQRRLSALFEAERRFWAKGVTRVAGVDEVGVGPLAGPVVAAAVVLPRGVSLPGLNDSKQLSIAARERLDALIRKLALGVAFGFARPAEIDELNVYHAGLVAMRRAVEGLRPAPELLLVDARTIPHVEMPQYGVTRGDSSVGSIAAASIVAKVYRDRWMHALGRRFPGYGFERNSGYGTAEHLAALRAKGPTIEHRRSFSPVRAAEALSPGS